MGSPVHHRPVHHRHDLHRRVQPPRGVHTMKKEDQLKRWMTRWMVGMTILAIIALGIVYYVATT